MKPNETACQTRHGKARALRRRKGRMAETMHVTLRIVAEQAVEIASTKENLARLSLLILGAHLWDIRMQTPATASMPSGCLCRCCDEARKSYRIATGLWPTTEQEHTAMGDWGKGERALGDPEDKPDPQ